MSRFKNILKGVLAVLVFTQSSTLYAQKDGVKAPKKSAMDNLYLNPEPWSGKRYTEPKSFKDRLYINASYGVGNLWKYNTEKLDSKDSGFNTNFSVGYHLAPLHALEVGFNLSNYFDFKNVNNFDFSYLFDVTAFANRAEYPGKWQFLLKSGVGIDVDKPAAFSFSVYIIIQNRARIII